MKNIYLVGFMGTGKTAIGRELAKKLNKDFFDLDEIIEEREKRKITEIFSQDGETYFRKIERETLLEFSQEKGKIIGCGGGVVLDSQNIQKMKETGIIICFTASPEIILERTKRYRHRPLLNVEDPLKKIKELLDFRRPYYKRGDYTIDTSNLNISEVVDKILELIR